jgi:hypothetical protein
MSIEKFTFGEFVYAFLRSQILRELAKIIKSIIIN